MVKLTSDLIIKSSTGGNKKRVDETIAQYFNRITHLYFQNKSIDSIDLIPNCKNLSVVYLYENSLRKIENFEFATQLTHLYLQNNQIKRLENLGFCKKLTVLHLGNNEISVVEGLEGLTELTELHIENQNLPAGEKLIFEPRSLYTLQSKLEILNISGNNLDTLSDLCCLTQLQHLFALNNKLNDMKEMNLFLKCLQNLVKLDLTGNPLCTKSKYRERIIVLAPNIQELDGKDINNLSRQFLQNWKTSKEIALKSKLDFVNDTNENNNHQQQQVLKETSHNIISQDFLTVNPLNKTFNK